MQIELSQDADNEKSGEIEKPQGHNEHYYALDLVRGLAAGAVLFWHYQHFFMASPSQHVMPEQRGLSPFYWFFGPLYDYGYIAVQIFWILSGFVFAAVYIERTTNSAAFFWARFARLYPLHLLTLIVVAALQYLSVALVGQEQIYTNNDTYHFALQIFFMSDWGWQRGVSFNGPIWSVSVEILLYIAFWATLPLLKKNKQHPAILITLVCWVLANFTSAAWHSIWTCGSYFFAGVAIWRARSISDAPPIHLACVSVILLVLGLNLLGHSPRLQNIIAIPLIATGTLCLALAADKSMLRRHFKSAQPLGNLTYGIYLWHVPIQIGILMAIQHWDVADIVYSPLFLFGFLASVLMVSAISYRYFEKPMRLRFRRKVSAPD